jgi:glycosyltransferase involved in cell wall biosynthesis
MAPRVSVCIDSFNYGRFLPEAIESVLGQSLQDFEIIISDDCARDDSFGIAQPDRGMTVTQTPWHLGTEQNRDVGREHGKTLRASNFLCSPPRPDLRCQPQS